MSASAVSAAPGSAAARRLAETLKSAASERSATSGPEQRRIGAGRADTSASPYDGTPVAGATRQELPERGPRCADRFRGGVRL